MANPFPGEDEVYKKIEKNKLSISKEFWQLIQHHIGNDITVIQLIVSAHLEGKSEPIPVEHAERILNRCDQIKKFLNKLRDKTNR